MEVDLMLLQERCRKDPLSYSEDYATQRRHFDALLSATAQRPGDPSPRLGQVSSFIGSVAHLYPSTKNNPLAPGIVDLLTQTGTSLNVDTRHALVKLLALLRARDAADAAVVLPLFFRLLQCNDKLLRRSLHGHILADLKRLQQSGFAGRRQLQTFLFTIVEDRDEVLVKRCLYVLVDLFRKRIWRDQKCANMIAGACFHESMSVALIAARFLLDAESREDDDDDEEDEEDGQRGGKDGQKAADMWKAYSMTGKKSSKKRKKMERVINRMTKTKAVGNTSAIEEKGSVAQLAAMMMLNDPQSFAERLFSELQTKRRKESYEHRLILINLISRLVGTFQLILFNLYPFLQRYLQPAQPEVTRVLAYLTQACHDGVPADVLHPILRGLADSFVGERSSPPAIAAGINTIRAICARVPLAILDEENEVKAESEQEAPLLEDLVQYKNSKDKGVMMAARGLIGLYREVQPGLLRKKDRGRIGQEAVHKGKAGAARAFGELVYATGVDGVELLDQATSDEESEEETEEAAEEEDAEEEDAEEEEEGVRMKKARIEGSEEPDGAEEKQDRGGESQDDNDEAGEQVRPKGTRVDALQILSDADFAKIRARRAAKAIGETELTTNTGAVVDPDDIQGPIKRERKTVAERLESVLQGREGREYGRQREKGGGSTNKKKLKTKSNAMVIHKRRNQNNLSRRQRQLAKRKKKDYR